MRLSIDEDDPGYSAWLALGDKRHDVRIFVNGVEIKNAITADAAESFVIVSETGKSGHILFDREFGEICTKRVTGRVEIRMA